MKCYCASTRQVARLLTRHYTEHLRPAGLTPPQFELLGNLAARPGLSQSQFAGILNLDQTTLSRNLKSMIGQGWVKSTPSDKDSRAVIYAITSKGLATLRAAMPLWQNAQRGIETLLGPDQAAVWTVLDRLNKSLQDQEHSAPAGSE